MITTLAWRYREFSDQRLAIALRRAQEENDFDESQAIKHGLDHCKSVTLQLLEAEKKRRDDSAAELHARLAR